MGAVRPINGFLLERSTFVYLTCYYSAMRFNRDAKPLNTGLDKHSGMFNSAESSTQYQHSFGLLLYPVQVKLAFMLCPLSAFAARHWSVGG